MMYNELTLTLVITKYLNMVRDIIAIDHSLIKRKQVSYIFLISLSSSSTLSS